MIPFDMHRDMHRQDSVESQHQGRGPRPYSPIQVIFLLRLARLLRQRQEYLQLLSQDDWRMRLLNKAIYSTYCDCVDQGLNDDAKALFERDKTTNRA